MRYALTVALTLSLALVTFPKDKHAPLPALILSAKTVYIDNQGGYSQITDRAYDELTKWGRFQVVDSSKKADIILRFAADTTPASTSTISTYNSSTQTWNHGTVRTGGETRVHLFVIDPATRDTLWTASETKAFHSQTREDIKELRKRIDEQEHGGTR